MREITADEVNGLKECLYALSEYHNEVSTNFKGSYPSNPYDKTLEIFADSVRKRISRIAVAEEGKQIVGFIKIDFIDEKGKLDYFAVLKEYRGKGYGKELMDWAMKSFDKNNIRQIEVKVVDGNEVIRLYEKYGFRMNSHILIKNR